MSKEFEAWHKKTTGSSVDWAEANCFNYSVEFIRSVWAAAESRGIAKGRIEGLREAAGIAENEMVNLPDNIEDTPEDDVAYNLACIHIKHAILSAAAPQHHVVQENEKVLAAIFDGYSVYQAMTDHAKRRTSAEQVGDVLDAVARVMKAAPQEIAGEGCVWVQKKGTDHFFDTACKDYICSTSATEIRSFKHCPYCGKVIVIGGER